MRRQCLRISVVCVADAPSARNIGVAAVAALHHCGSSCHNGSQIDGVDISRTAHLIISLASEKLRRRLGRNKRRCDRAELQLHFLQVKRCACGDGELYKILPRCGYIQAAALRARIRP